MPALKTAAPAKKYYKMKDNVTGYLLLAPWLFGFFFMWLIPAAMSIYYSLTDYNLLSAPNFVGLKNYITIFTNDKNFKQAMIVTFSYVFMVVPLRLAFALFVATLLNKKHKGMAVYRVLYYIPSIVGGSIAVAVVWKQIFGNKGVFMTLLGAIGIEQKMSLLGNPKTALFVIISDTDDTFNFVVAIMYSQLFNLLCDKADDVYNGRLPVHVRCLLDEFANIGQIPKFDKLIATIRSREISASIILQSQSQLKTIYKDAADTIVGNCDCTLFLGGKEKSTLKELSEILGKETIDLYNTSETRSTNNSYGLNYQKTGKQLMSEDEIAVMDGGKCILQLRGVRPFLSDKYDITKHPKYKMLSDYDKRNAFDIEKYRSHKLVVKPTQTFDLYDMGEVEAD